MKAIIFTLTPFALIFASINCDAVGYTVAGAFTFASALLIFYSIYRHLAANRLI